MARQLRFSRELLTTLSCYALIAGLLLVSFAVARVGGVTGSLFEAPVSRLIVSAGAVALALGASGLALSFFRAGADHRTHFGLPTVMATVVSIAIVGFAELALRLTAAPDPLGRRVGATVLMPYEWGAVASTNRALLERNPPETAYYVYDPTLGWDIGPSRASSDGLYFSSPEGLRSARRGESIPKADPRRTIALLGNSFAFSEEVEFADSLGVALEAALGIETHRVLNFGVPGFGVDQAALKFVHAAEGWKPEVAILAFIEDDIFRTANTYAFLKADWQLPLSKPRYELLPNGELTLYNVPTMTPDEMFSKPSILDLPRMEGDIEYFEPHWRWHPLHSSLLMRFLASRFPVWPPEDRDAEDAQLAELGSRIIERFVQDAASSGVRPVVVYLPTSGDLNPRGRRVVKRLLIERLEARGLPVRDLTSCIRGQLPPPDLFLTHGHYSRSGNAATATCLLPFLLEVAGPDAETPSAVWRDRASPTPSLARSSRE